MDGYIYFKFDHLESMFSLWHSRFLFIYFIAVDCCRAGVHTPCCALPDRDQQGHILGTAAADAAGFLHFDAVGYVLGNSHREDLRIWTVKSGLRRLSFHNPRASRTSMRESRSSVSSFRTQIHVQKLIHPQIAINDTICLLGSCFTENVGEKLKSMKFCVDVNPFGISFNPISLCRNLKTILNGFHVERSNLRFDGERWFCYDHHSSFSGRDPEVCLKNMNERINHGRQCLLQARVLFITLGSAWAYKLRETDTV